MLVTGFFSGFVFHFWYINGIPGILKMFKVEKPIFKVGMSILVDQTIFAPLFVCFFYTGINL